MVRYKFSLAVFILLVPTALCWYDDELRELWKTIRADICNVLISDSLVLSDYIKNFDQHWNFTYSAKKIEAIRSSWDFFIRHEDRDCPNNGYDENFA